MRYLDDDAIRALLDDAERDPDSLTAEEIVTRSRGGLVSKATSPHTDLDTKYAEVAERAAEVRSETRDRNRRTH
ncbi:hypothetical protein ASE14_06455 [Agromyces sp. Root81]|uniref:hypothetical protein n=1 Tax=Agromyces sp. Root81 TaxID=1736601 RepID=UPI0006F30758|nr:hypothetical protein [Agromyces sp. Root81]KRC60628.1 hypothetical protein ASE14_06455 [Agromyces sp. Root81]